MEDLRQCRHLGDGLWAPCEASPWPLCIECTCTGNCSGPFCAVLQGTGIPLLNGGTAKDAGVSQAREQSWTSWAQVTASNDEYTGLLKDSFEDGSRGGHLENKACLYHISLRVCIHAGQHNHVQRCMPDHEHTNLFAGMEHLSVKLPEPADFHNYIAPSFRILIEPELGFIEEPASAQAFCCTQCTEKLAESMTYLWHMHLQEVYSKYLQLFKSTESSCHVE